MKPRITLALLAAEPLALPATPFAADRQAGQAAWAQDHAQNDGALARRCTICHGSDLTKPGRHRKTGKTGKTGKTIGLMAPWVDPQRRTDAAKVEKRCKRNGAWTLGRERTAGEQANFIAYVKTQ